MRLHLAHREGAAQASPGRNFAPDVAPQVRTRRRVRLGGFPSTLVYALLNKAVTYCAGACAIRRNMKKPESSAPSTSWMKKGNVPETGTGCRAPAFATSPGIVYPGALGSSVRDAKDSCPHNPPDWAAEWKGPAVFLGSPSGTSEQRKRLWIKLPSSPQSAHGGESVLAARWLGCWVHCPSTTTDR